MLVAWMSYRPSCFSILGHCPRASMQFLGFLTFQILHIQWSQCAGLIDRQLAFFFSRDGGEQWLPLYLSYNRLTLKWKCRSKEEVRFNAALSGSIDLASFHCHVALCKLQVAAVVASTGLWAPHVTVLIGLCYLMNSTCKIHKVSSRCLLLCISQVTNLSIAMAPGAEWSRRGSKNMLLGSGE